jgi:hypothetical protein
MSSWPREARDGQVSVLAQRAASEGPRCMRAVETSPPLLPNWSEEGGNKCGPGRMLKKPASGVLASVRGSTCRSVRLAPSLAAALLDGLFEHPDVIPIYSSIQKISSMFSVSTKFFRSLLEVTRHALRVTALSLCCWHKKIPRITHYASHVTVFSLLLAGCATVPPTEDLSLRRATAQELIRLLDQRESAIQSIKGLFTAKVRGGVIPIATRVEGALYYRRPNAMRLRGFTAIGGELFEFVQVDDLYRLRLPTMGRVLAGRQSEMGDMGKLTRPFQLSLWAMNGMLGTGTIAAGEAVALTEEGDRYRLDVYESQSRDAPLLRRVWFDRHNLLVVQEDRFTSNGDLDATIRYDDFRLIEHAAPGPVQAAVGEDVPLLRPFKISLEDGRGQGSVHVTFHEIVPNQVLKAEELGQIS